jgi:hypothetical protein
MSDDFDNGPRGNLGAVIYFGFFTNSILKRSLYDTDYRRYRTGIS